MTITYDPQRLKARHLTANDVKNFVDKANFNQSGGYFVQGNREWTIRTVGELLNAEAFRKLIISKPGDPIVYLSDVADVQDSYDRPNSYSRINGQRGIIFNVLGQAGANILDTINSVDSELQRLQKDYGPRGAKFEKMYDSSDYIRDAVRVVKTSLIEAIMLVLLVLFVFLKNWRSIFIVATSIPVSIIGTFIGMYLFKYSINVLSLAGLALSVGMIVDDAIVVLENIYRHRYEEGKSIVRACVDGTHEVGTAVLMSTLTTAAVFMPILLLKGEVGTLFGPVAFIISVAIFLSLFDAFTVVPMLASRWMKRGNRTQGVLETDHVSSQSFWTRSVQEFPTGCIWSLRFFLGSGWRKAALVVSVLAVFVLSYKALPGMGYLPTGGTNLIKVQIATAEGTSLDENSRLMQILEDRWRKIKGVRNLIAVPNRQDSRNVIFLVCDREEDSGVSGRENSASSKCHGPRSPRQVHKPHPVPLVRKHFQPIQYCGCPHCGRRLSSHPKTGGADYGSWERMLKGLSFVTRILPYGNPRFKLKWTSSERQISAFKAKTLPMRWKRPEEANRLYPSMTWAADISTFRLWARKAT